MSGPKKPGRSVKPNIKIIKKDWEYPITRGAGKILVAVPDMIVTYQRPRFLIKKDGKYDELEFITTQAGFEVKSKIASLGEVLRQINIYKEYSSASRWFLVSKQTNVEFYRILKEQNINLIEYDGKPVQDEYIDNDGKTRKIPIPGLDDYLGIDIVKKH